MNLAVQSLQSCRTPQEIHACVREHGLNSNDPFQLALVRNPRTPLAVALKIFWFHDPFEGLMHDRSTGESGFLLEIIKRVEIGYYPKGGIPWSHFDDAVPAEEEVEDMLEELQGIVPRCMLGTEFNP